MLGQAHDGQAAITSFDGRGSAHTLTYLKFEMLGQAQDGLSGQSHTAHTLT